MYRLKCSPRRVVSGNCSDCQASAVTPVNDGHAPERLGSMAIETQIGRDLIRVACVVPSMVRTCWFTRVMDSFSVL